MKNVANEYRLFHTARIINILLEQQTPYNTAGEKDLSDCGNFKLKLDSDKANEILQSLFEIGMIGYCQKELMIRALNIKEADIKFIKEMHHAENSLSCLFD